MAEGEIFGLFTQPFFTNIILPFLLVFTVIFAILEKTQVLGEGKKYANLIVALVVGFMFVGVQNLVGFTLRFIPVVSVLIIVLLSYFLIFGFIGVHMAKGLQITLGIIFGIGLLVSILWATGLTERMSGLGSNALGTILIFVIIAGAIALVTSMKTTPAKS